MHCRATKDVNTSEATRSEMLSSGEGGRGRGCFAFPDACFASSHKYADRVHWQRLN